ncbi:MAG: HD domain-containing protein [Acidiferrobacterales bacterium]
MKRPNEAEIEKAVNVVNKLIELMPQPRRTFVVSMLAGMGTSYFTAPASSREEFHSCFPGGLIVHSLNVVGNLRNLARTLCPGKYDDATLAFVGLFHDLGKAGDGEQELYIPNQSDWHRQKGMLYETNKDLPYMSTAQRSLFVLQKHDIKLETEEYLAILLNDGMYVEANKDYRMKEPDLALLLHWADRFACNQEKSEAGA